MEKIILEEAQLEQMKTIVLDWYQNLVSESFEDSFFYWIGPSAFEPWLDEEQKILLNIFFSGWMFENAKAILNISKECEIVDNPVLVYLKKDVIEHTLSNPQKQLLAVLQSLEECGWHNKAYPLRFLFMVPDENNLVLTFTGILPLTKKEQEKNVKLFTELSEKLERS